MINSVWFKVEISRERVKEAELITLVEYITILNYGREQESISSMKYDDKIPQTKGLK